jgi:hypothetical protein
VTIDFDDGDDDAAEPAPVPSAASPTPEPPAPRPAASPARRTPGPDMLREIEDLLVRGALVEAQRKIDALGTLGYDSPPLDELRARVGALTEPPARVQRDAPPAGLIEDDDLGAITAALESELLAPELSLPTPDPESEQSLADVFAAFRQHVAEEIEGDDYRTHYDLGIAYKEMGLLDDSIEQFRRVLARPSCEPKRWRCSPCVCATRDGSRSRRARTAKRSPLAAGTTTFVTACATSWPTCCSARAMRSGRSASFAGCWLRTRRSATCGSASHSSSADPQSSLVSFRRRGRLYSADSEERAWTDEGPRRRRRSGDPERDRRRSRGARIRRGLDPRRNCAVAASRGAGRRPRSGAGARVGRRMGAAIPGCSSWRSVTRTKQRSRPFDSLDKPVDESRLRGVARRPAQRRGAAIENRALAGRAAAKRGRRGNRRALSRTRELLAAVSRHARSPEPVWFAGESGVGKQHAARVMHAMSERGGLDFTLVPCASIAFAEPILAEPCGTLYLENLPALPLDHQRQVEARATTDRGADPAGSWRRRRRIPRTPAEVGSTARELRTRFEPNVIVIRRCASVRKTCRSWPATSPIGSAS